MNREPISYYLKNPSKLVDLSLSEIEKWLQESPFSQPIRALLAKKLIFDQEIVLDPVIIGAASTASNRTWLYRELHSGIEFKTDSSTASAEAVENVEIFNDHSTPITENNESIYTLDENIQDIENKVISNDIKEEVLEDRDEDGAALDLEGQLKETNEEIAIEQLLSIKQEKSSEDSKATSEIQVIRADTDKEFIAGRDDDKKKAKKKKKDKKKIKKDKKSEEKDKKKKKTAKKAKKKAKREKREPSENKALDVFWDEKEEIAHSKKKKEKASKRKFKIKNKKSKIQLLKYDIPVSPYEEEANHYDHDLDDLSELSNYTQWLLHFSKDKADGSYNHMWIASSKSNKGRDNISTPSSEAKKKEKKSKNRAKKIPTKAKKK